MDFICRTCKSSFYIAGDSLKYKKAIYEANRRGYTCFQFCSRRCGALHSRKTISVACFTCGKSYFPDRHLLKKNKRHFCSSVCRRAFRGNYVSYTCAFCSVSFLRLPYQCHGGRTFCSVSCLGRAKRNEQIISCEECGIPRAFCPSKVKASTHHFCSKKCNAIYRSKHKTYGCQASKLERFVEGYIRSSYPSLSVFFRNRQILGLELDIYFPTLNLAFEFNGPCHYLPIYGEALLLKIKEKDCFKFSLCQQKGIALHIIDVSKYNFKPSTACVYRDFVCGYLSSPY